MVHVFSIEAIKADILKMQWRIHTEWQKKSDYLEDKELSLSEKIKMYTNCIKRIRTLKHDIKYFEAIMENKIK